MLRNALAGSPRSLLTASVSLDSFALPWRRFLRCVASRDLLQPLLPVFRELHTEYDLLPLHDSKDLISTSVCSFQPSTEVFIP
jgi:hypothetical protein